MMVQGFIEIAALVSPRFNSMRDTAREVAEGINSTTADLALKTNESFGQIFGDFSATQTIEQQLASLAVTAEAASTNVKTAYDGIKNSAQSMTTESLSFMEQFKIGFYDLGQTSAQIAQQMGKTFRNGLVNGIGNGFAQLGKALVTGENLFKAFGAAVLASFGQVLIQLGTQTIAAGLGMQLAPFLFGLQGIGAVIAGAGMVTAGGVLTALAGSGGGSSPAGGAAGGPGGAFGGIATDPFGGQTQLAEQERQQPMTGVTVNVQGNIMDRKQTGLELAEIIRENFDLAGVTTVGA